LEPRRSTTLWSTRGEDRGTRTHGKPNRENEGRLCPPVFEGRGKPASTGNIPPTGSHQPSHPPSKQPKMGRAHSG
jgi:hypothetical protein